MKLLVLTIMSIFYLSGCFESGDLDSTDHQKNNADICVENSTVRACTPREKAMIKDMHAIISAVTSYKHNPKAFFTNQVGSDESEMLFFGENHSDILGQIETLSYLNQIAKPGDVLLLEGIDWENNTHINNLCGISLIFRVFANWQWQKTGNPYIPKDREKFFKEQNFAKLLLTTIFSYFSEDFRSLPLNNLRCFYWDDGESLDKLTVLDESPKNARLSYKLHKQRNKTQTKALSYWRPRSERILVNAGYAHLPSGDKLLAQAISPREISSSMALSEYYAKAKAQRKNHPTSRFINDNGSSKPIYDYLKEQNISYSEIIPRRSLF